MRPRESRDIWERPLPVLEPQTLGLTQVQQSYFSNALHNFITSKARSVCHKHYAQPRKMNRRYCETEGVTHSGSNSSLNTYWDRDGHDLIEL